MLIKGVVMNWLWITLGSVFVAFLALLALGCCALYRAIFPKEDLEIYTKDGRFREDVFPPLNKKGPA